LTQGKACIHGPVHHFPSRYSKANAIE
jgi:hypothetical protein